ncbi:MAG: hypothetical protein J6X14_10450 [Lachnospiraceae bacterium]|jgi:hypothetical protein|nr:hypothetical protein [Lachnospiraceae bacterium]MBO7339337.1 hypothetical protein [Lachnospiraceae bacterium]MBP5262941.1 hypothetical protein [Lachnospiraceae bacterium]MBP5670707.1 hypothetical protein [Lachnospiraceae bacterium]MBP5734069.1 hypothetical protein [Lachnospiraceae bacterium]
MTKWLELIDSWNFVGLAIVGISVLIFIAAFFRYARKKMSDGLMMIWFVMSLIVFILGFVLIITGYKSGVIVSVTCIACALLLVMIFIVSSMVSELMMKVRELAMQVALLNQENDSMLQQINKLKEHEKDA